MPSTHNYLVQKPFSFGCKIRNAGSAKRTAITLHVPVSSTGSFPHTAHLKNCFSVQLNSLPPAKCSPFLSHPTSSRAGGPSAGPGPLQELRRGGCLPSLPTRPRPSRRPSPHRPTRSPAPHLLHQPTAPTASRSRGALPSTERLGVASTAGKKKQPPAAPWVKPQPLLLSGPRQARGGGGVTTPRAPAVVTNGWTGAPHSLTAVPHPSPSNKGGPGPRRRAGAAAPRGDPAPSPAPSFPAGGAAAELRTASSLRGCRPSPAAGCRRASGRGVSQAALPGCATLTHSRAARRLRSVPLPRPPRSTPRSTRLPRLPPR